MNKKIAWFLLAVVFIGILSYFVLYNKNSENVVLKNSKDKMLVTASFYPLYYFSSAIGGDKVSVENITPVGAEPHDYEPTPQDVANMTKSKVVVLLGDTLEAWGASVRMNLNSDKTVVVIAGDGLTNKKAEENGKMIVDPHVWLSPVLAQQMVNKILAGYIKADPQNETYYTQNANNLKLQLANLDNEFKTGLATCAKRDIVTSHSAFGYLAGAYNLIEVPIAGLSPDAEPSAMQLADIVKFAKANNIKYVFFERLVSPKLSETIANEVGAKNIMFDPLEGLTNDDLNNGVNYMTQMRQNLANLRIALECN